MTYHFATYGTLQRFGRTQTRICPQDGKVSFRYPQIVHDHFYYRDVCDNQMGGEYSQLPLRNSCGQIGGLLEALTSLLP